jgi:hypothetical protein
VPTWSPQTRLPFYIVARTESHGVYYLSFGDLWTTHTSEARVFGEREVAEQTRRRLRADAVLPLEFAQAWVRAPLIVHREPLLAVA